jgi:protein TonB
MPGVDILDQRDPVGKPFAGSLLFHGSLFLFVAGASYLGPKPISLGDPNPAPGAIGVSMVKTIPIPRHEGPLNRLANDTQSIVPMAPEPKVAPKPVVKEKLPPPDAVLIPKREKTKPKRIERAAQPPQFKADRLPDVNQVYSTTPQRMSAPEYQMQGTNGIGIGKTANPFGEQFGWYAQLIRDRISSKWNRADVTSRPHAKAILRFILMADGSVQNVQLSQSSGSPTLDTSSQRALMDASPLPPLPKALNRSSVTIDLEFELQQ